jgi:hypothetical protein
MKWVFVFLSILLIAPLTPAYASDVQELGRNAGIEVSVKPSQASAEALVALPSLYLLPDSPLYWLRQVFEELQLLLAANERDRVNLLLQFSQRRLAEGYQAVKEGKVESAVKSLQQYRQDHQELATKVEQFDPQADELKPIFTTLKEQLELQDLLKSFVDHQRRPELNEVSALLSDSAMRSLVFQLDPSVAVLGAEDQRQPVATGSASMSAQPNASTSAGRAQP